MEMFERRIRDVTVFDVRGRCDIKGGKRLRRAVRQQAQGGRTKIVLNLTNVSLIDSEGLDKIVHCHAITRVRGGTLKFVGLTRAIPDLAAFTRRLPNFEMFNGVEEAIASFERPT